MNLTDWSQVFRIPTLPVVVLPVMGGFLAGGGELFSPFGGTLFAWSVILHHFTFGHNSLMDAVSGHDSEKDPRTHPLVRLGTSTAAARKVIFPGLVLAMGLGAVLSLSGGGRASLSLVCLLLFSALGHAYNGVSKFTRWSFLPISSAFACLPAYSYFAVSDTVGVMVVPLVGFTFLTMWFEADFEGALKDIKTKEKSTLKSLGVEVNWGRIEWGCSWIYGGVLKLAGLEVITYTILWGTPTLSTTIAWAFFSSVAIAAACVLMTTESWDRERIMVLTGVEELSSFSLLLVATVPAAGWTPAALLIIFSILWVLTTSSAVYGASVWRYFIECNRRGKNGW